MAEAIFRRLERGETGGRLTLEEAIDEPGGVPDPTPATLDDGQWPRTVSGAPDTLAGLLEQLAERVGVDEVMIQHAHADHADALRSHELLADGVGLSRDDVSRPPAAMTFLGPRRTPSLSVAFTFVAAEAGREGFEPGTRFATLVSCGSNPPET